MDASERLAMKSVTSPAQMQDDARIGAKLQSDTS